MLNSIKKDIKKASNKKKAKLLSGFFKTGKGEYGEGDIFLGLTVPQCRKIAQKYNDLSFTNIKQLIKSKIHEERLITLLILVNRFSEAQEEDRKKIFTFYLANTKHINNWDLVDLSADKIVGEYLLNKSKTTLFALARSKNIWERRIAILATFQLIKNGRFQETLQIVKIVLNDSHDLIQKAAGWMLREGGKRCSEELLKNFLNEYSAKMPRTMLRYAVERFPKLVRDSYLQKKT